MVSDGNEYDMAIFNTIDDEQIEGLLAGSATQDAALHELAPLIEELRAEANIPVTEELAAGHIAMASEAAQDAVGLVATTTKYVAATSTPGLVTRCRNRIAVSSLLSGLVAKILIGSVALVPLCAAERPGRDRSKSGDLGPLRIHDDLPAKIGSLNGP